EANGGFGVPLGLDESFGALAGVLSIRGRIDANHPNVPRGGMLDTRNGNTGSARGPTPECAAQL
ncbi:MAG TPA: hypothetical protein VGP10_06640, partial [Marisediminicola sp.]|nr:hypothetical protein [Marisediminicola sp.]